MEKYVVFYDDRLLVIISSSKRFADEQELLRWYAHFYAFDINHLTICHAEEVAYDSANVPVKSPETGV